MDSASPASCCFLTARIRDSRPRTRVPIAMTGSLPVFAIGVGAATGLRDREVLSIAAGDQRLTDASVDLQVSASSSGFGRAPYEIRLLANGALVRDTTRVAVG